MIKTITCKKEAEADLKEQEIKQILLLVEQFNRKSKKNLLKYNSFKLIQSLIRKLIVVINVDKNVKKDKQYQVTFKFNKFKIR